MGRGISFDKDEVFNQCLQAFWKNGFDNTSIRDLQKLTGLSGRSLIHSFGDKRQVFDLCVTHYMNFVEELTQELINKDDGLEVFFDAFIQCDCSDVRNNGCFLLNSIYGELRGDSRLTETFTQFTKLLTEFFSVQLEKRKIADANEKATIIFDLFLAGLTKISIYGDARQMESEYKIIKALID